MNGYWLFTPLLLPLFLGGLALPWLHWRDSGELPLPSPGGWLALLAAGALLLSSTLLGENNPLHAWLGLDRPLPRALPAVWAIYGLPCWGAALALWPAPLARRLPGQSGNQEMARALIAFAGWALLLVAGLIQLIIA
ncbi:hypothetical protein [Pseudomonas mangrovi]|uniref:Uncharacterized protein n=1 Tax=Pseudomonas mangrovi TaxID=2161748 RepID=A0A2T5PE08_9PSED|nr:hypothetical protein [Pseudomonas mangrovi]PTU75972.1 hypothetical protein DBO85_02515 [Pseudomonas mangrovi]